MRLICYATSGVMPEIVPAAVEREWMERTPQGFAYRCLPLNIANSHGWMVLNPAAFLAEWNGGPGLDAVTVRALPGAAGAPPLVASSHFGFGVLTFTVNGLFRTEPGWDLYVTGPVNRPKDAITALSGIVETDWAPFTFTMNWKFTRKHTPVTFEAGEPFCMFFPVERGRIEQVEPEMRPIDSDPEVQAAFAAWSDSRRRFNEGLQVPGSEAQVERWQKDYFRGSDRFGERVPDDHRTKLRVRPFDRRG